MEDIIRKVIAFEVKEVAPRVLEFVGSTEDRDRAGDIIMASGWQLKNYKKNPVFLWAHQYDMPPVGKATKVWAEDNRLKFNIQFATRDEYEFADTVYKLYKGGYLRATSVGFMPLESEPITQKEDDDMLFHQATRFLKQDLLELSGCPVPANPNALAEAKAKSIVTDSEINQILRAEGEPEDALRVKPYPNEHACRLRNPDDFEDGSFKRTKRRHEEKEYSVIMGKLKGEDAMTEQAYRYGKEVWTEAEAGNHCKEHDGTFEPAEEERHEASDITQSMIADDIDYLRLALSQEGLNESGLSAAWELVDDIVRLSGDDIPVDIQEKVGAVLNKKNRERLEQIKSLAQEVIDSAESTEPGEPEDNKGLTTAEIQETVRQAVAETIRKAQGK